MSKVFRVIAHVYQYFEIFNYLHKLLDDTIGEDYELSVESRGETVAYIAKACPMCTGKQAGVAICSIFSGKLEGAVRLSTGKEHQVVETSCRAKGDLACASELSKAAKKE